MEVAVAIVMMVEAGMLMVVEVEVVLAVVL